MPRVVYDGAVGRSVLWSLHYSQTIVRKRGSPNVPQFPRRDSCFLDQFHRVFPPRQATVCNCRGLDVGFPSLSCCFQFHSPCVVSVLISVTTDDSLSRRPPSWRHLASQPKCTYTRSPCRRSHASPHWTSNHCDLFDQVDVAKTLKWHNAGHGHACIDVIRNDGALHFSWPDPPILK